MVQGRLDQAEQTCPVRNNNMMFNPQSAELICKKHGDQIFFFNFNPFTTEARFYVLNAIAFST